MKRLLIPIMSIFVLAVVSSAGERPPVTQPRSTSGDTAVEPDWKQKLTITVSPKDADIVGSTDKAIQAGVDYVARLGGGTVKILPGTYRLRNSIFLQSKVRLLGSGEQTILYKEPSVTTKLAVDSDWYDQEITLANADGFQVGDGITLRARGDGKTYDTYLKRTLIARTGNRFKLDRPLRDNFWRLGNAVAISVFPLVTGENVADLTIENLTLDGNRAKNDNLNGNYGGCLFFQDCNRITLRGVTARNYNGDGISWQICHDVLVEDCVSENHAGLGLHPGSGSQRPIMRNNRLTGNTIGLFFCWGVRHGLAEGNIIEGNGTGISIGHHDTDNLVTGNNVSGSGKTGVLFRPERGADFTGNRNRIEKNILVNNGAENGAAIEVQGGTRDVVIVGNEITEKRGAGGRTAIRLGGETENIRTEDNTVSGFAKEQERGGK